MVMFDRAKQGQMPILIMNNKVKHVIIIVSILFIIKDISDNSWEEICVIM